MQKDKSLSATDIADLWKEYKETNNIELRNQLIENYLPLVNKIAGHISYNLPSHIERDELMSSGFFGLMDAVTRFDVDLGIKFEAYARNRVRGAILDYLRSKDWLSVSLRKKIKIYENVYTELEVKLQRTPKKQELAEALSMTIDELHQLEAKINTASLTSLEDYINIEYAGGQNNSIDKKIDREFVQQKLSEAIDKLPEKEKLVISLYYSEELTLKEIGLALELSEARISQLHKKAVLRLRGYLARSKADFF